MKNIRFFLSENFQFLEVKVSIYLNRRVFVMRTNVHGPTDVRVIEVRLYVRYFSYFPD